MSVIGRDVEHMHIEITSSRPGVVTIPVGTIFASNSPTTQNMMSAKTAQVTIATPNQPERIDIEVYCINRLLDAPFHDSTFTVVEGGPELDPIRRLAAFLESKNADHYTRQLAIWLMSENHLNLTQAEVRRMLYGHDIELLNRISNSQMSVEDLKRSFPALPEEQIRKMRNHVQTLKDEVRSYLTDQRLSSDDISEIVENFGLSREQELAIRNAARYGNNVTEVLVQSIITAQMIPAFSEAIEKEISLYKTSARKLLEEYDPGLMKSTFFTS